MKLACQIRTHRSGFTLLEVLLTLSMSVVLIALMHGALQFYARDMTAADQDIRRTQLAAAVMQMIEDDLRATLHPQPVDTSGLESLLASSLGNAGGGQAAAGGEDLSAAGIDDTTSTDSVSETTTLDLQSGVAVLETPGLIGNQYQVQLDLSRLPRLEEYVAMIDGNTADIEDVPSDIKTVAYFVQGAGMIAGVQDPLETLNSDATPNAVGGLVRRSLDRSVTVYAASNGNLTMLNQTGELLAPEITSIEFSYWDGITWQMQWSSDEYGELPLAIQVTLTVADPAADADTSNTVSVDPTSVRTFTHVIRLPMAQPIETEDELMGAGI